MKEVCGDSLMSLCGYMSQHCMQHVQQDKIPVFDQDAGGHSDTLTPRWKMHPKLQYEVPGQ